MDAETLADNLTRVQAHLQYEVAQTRGLRVRVAALEAQNERLRRQNEAALHLFERDFRVHQEGLPVDWRWLATEMAKALAHEA